MRCLPIRLSPGADLRGALEAAVAEQGVQAAFVVAGIGSLSEVVLRRAGVPQADRLVGDFELLTLSGSLAGEGSHLHASVADAQGTVLGGHLGPGCVVRTTAEVLVALLDDWRFAREQDPRTGYQELVVRPAADPS